jgi:hypothetical protein
MDFMRCADLMARTAVVYLALGFALPTLEAAIDGPSASRIDASRLATAARTVVPAYPVWRVVSELDADQLTAAVFGYAGFGAFLGLVVSILIPFDLAHQRGRGLAPFDVTYYPTLRGLRQCLTVVPARMVLIVGLLLLAGWLAHTQLDLIRNSFWGNPHGPPRIIAAGLVAWGIVWLADCITRPKGGTYIAAMWFLLVALFILYTVEQIGIVRE